MILKTMFTELVEQGVLAVKVVAVSLVSEKDVVALDRLEIFLKSKLTIGWLDDADLVTDFRRFPYSYDPKGSLRDVKSRGGRDDKGSRGKNSYSKEDRPPRTDKKPYDKDSRPPRKEYKKKEYKKKDYNDEQRTAAPVVTKPKTNKKRKTSSRYANYKTVSKGSGKGLLGKIFGLFK